MFKTSKSIPCIISINFITRLIINISITLAFPLSAIAHGPGLEEINNINTQLSENDKQVDLYIKRGHIYQDNQRWQEAMSDFNKAATLAPDNIELDLARAQLSYSAGEYMRALDFINLYLIRHIATTETSLISARAYRELKQYSEAAKYYALALSDLSSLDGRPLPDWYVEFSDTLILSGEKLKALQALQQGIKVLGPIYVFQNKAANLELELGRYASALARIDHLLSQAQRKDFLLMRRGDIFSKAGRNNQAKTTYQEAYTELQNLPQRLKDSPASVELASTLQSRLSNQ